jgi:hypothetical protein
MAFKRLAIALLFVISIVGFYSFNNDDDILAKVNQQLTEWTESHPVEKVYLHFDKPYYTAGDDVWFKAYVTTGNLHHLSFNNDILNVELVNGQDSVEQSLKLQINEGLAAGDFALPDTLHAGDYRIRAYTQYMLNAGQEYIFDHAITIGNVITNKVNTQTEFNYVNQNGRNDIKTVINYTDTDGKAYAGNTVDYSVLVDNKAISTGKGVTDNEGRLILNLPAENSAIFTSGRILTKLTIAKGNYINKVIPVKITAGKADVQFFPEGGNMLNGVSNKVAFKAIGTNGLGLNIKGVVTNSKGTEVAKLSSSHLGMGVFEFTPQAAETYRAEVVFSDGSKTSISLPAAVNNGYVLKVSESGLDNIRLTIAAAKGTTGQCYLVGQTGGKVYYSAKSINTNNVFSAVVPKLKFPSGITQFTLFSASGEPLNERLVFIQNPEDGLKLTVSADGKKYSPRQAVRLNINATDNGDEPAESNLSVSVIDESKVPVDENLENNIMANLLLTSDIKGYVEQPAYYFNNVNDKTRSDLDALMLTQGYRRFEWKSVLNTADVVDKYPHQTAFNISGTVFSKKGKPLANCKVELVDYENALNNVDAVTDENGHFKFDEIVYPDSSSFFIYARGDKFNKDAIIKMDPQQVGPPATRYKNAADFNIVNATENKTAYEKSSKQLFAEQMKFGLGNHAINLKEVVIKDKFKTVRNSANIHPDLTDQVLIGKDIGSGCRYFIDCLQGRVAGVSFKGGKPYSNRTDRPMLTIVDGIPDPEGMVLSRLNSNDVEGVEVIRGGKVSIYGFGSGNGVIFVTTKRTLTTGRDLTKASADAPQRIEKGVIRYKPKGVYTARVFYSPLYDANTNQTLADLRTTIFWQPNVVTNDGKASIEFANAGSTGTYRVVVEGISSEGSIGRQVFRYKVE